jgi:hypothetical protein
MRISYFRALLIYPLFKSSQHKKNQAHPIGEYILDMPVQQAFQFDNEDYTLTQHHILGHLRLQQFQLGSFKVDILSELGYYFSKHQLLNKWFTTTSFFGDFPADFQESAMTEKNIHQLAAHLGMTFNWFLNPKIAVFGYGSIGPMWTSKLTERLAAGFAFSDNIGLGFKIQYNEQLWISSTLVLRHESNADFKFPNSGHNTIGLRLGLVFN